MSQKIPVLFGGIAKHRVDALREMSALLPNNLVAIDLVSLSVFRLIWNRDDYQVGTALFIYVDAEYLDIAVVRNRQYLGIHTIRRSYPDIIEDEISQADTIQKINQALVSIFNFFPDMEPPDRVVVATSKESIREFQEVLETAFSEFKIDFFEVKQTITFSTEFYNSERLKENYNPYIPAIGMALRFLERGRPSLSLTKIKLKLEPVFNRLELFLTGIAAAVLVLIFSGWSWQLHLAYRETHQDLQKIREEMVAVQSGQVVMDENKLKDIQNKIKLYGQYRNERVLKTPILTGVLQDLPEDITFDRLEIAADDRVKINGNAYRSESMLRFNRQLQQRFSNVEIQNVQAQTDPDGRSMSRFEVNFDRSLDAGN